MMKSRISVLLGAILFLSTAAMAQKVSVDWDHNVTNFSRFKTYSWAKPDRPTPNPLVDERIVADIDAALASKGLQKVPAGGDLAVTYSTGLRQERSGTINGMGGWRFGGGMATLNQQIEDVGTLVVSMGDAGARKLIWRGVASGTLSDKPEKNTEKIKKAVDKMFKQYPPKSKGK